MGINISIIANDVCMGIIAVIALMKNRNSQNDGEKGGGQDGQRGCNRDDGKGGQKKPSKKLYVIRAHVSHCLIMVRVMLWWSRLEIWIVCLPELNQDEIYIPDLVSCASTLLCIIRH